MSSKTTCDLPHAINIIYFTDRIGASSGNNFSFEPQISVREASPGFDELNNQIEEARLQSVALEEKRKVTRDKLTRKEKKKDKKKKKADTGEYHSNSSMSEVESAGGTSNIIPSEMLPSERVLEDEAKERQEEEERRKNREPPVVFTNIDVRKKSFRFSILQFLTFCFFV